MPYVTPQQIKEKAGDRAGTVFQNLDRTFVGANPGAALSVRVDELMAVFAERFASSIPALRSFVWRRCV